MKANVNVPLQATMQATTQPTTLAAIQTATRATTQATTKATTKSTAKATTKTVYETLIFQDRVDAGRQLARKLMRYRDENPIVLALPRGGVVVGYEVAHALSAPLDVIVARKLGVPGHARLSIGAIAPGNARALDQEALRWLRLSQYQLDRIVAGETVELNRSVQIYRGDRVAPEIHGRTVILVDDGLATGMTAYAALLSLQQQEPHRLVVAVPVGARQTAEAMRTEVDDLVCASIPDHFRAVGLWYRNFETVTDAEAICLLERNRGERLPKLNKIRYEPE